MEIRGATCSFAQSGLEDNGVSSGMFLGNLGVVRDALCRLKKKNPNRWWLLGENRWTLWLTQMVPARLQGNSRCDLLTAGDRADSAGSAPGWLVGWCVFLLPIDITYRPCCSWLEGVLRADASRGGSCGDELLSLPWFLCGEETIKVKRDVRQTASGFLLRERPAQ